MKRKSIKIILVIVAIVIYANIGYLVAYSTSLTTIKTPTAEIVYKIMDFYGVEIGKKSDGSFYFVWAVIFWPVIVIVYWMINLLFMFMDIGMRIFVWVFTGGFWKLVGFIK